MHAFVLLLAVPFPDTAVVDRFQSGAAVAALIDARLGEHWSKRKVTPAQVVDDRTFLRRVTLDLAGRIPTRAEAQAFSEDPSPDRRQRAVRRLMESPEYALHLGRSLDTLLQDRLAGDSEFIEYLRTCVAEHKPWDAIFREILLGPWDTKDRKRADRFLAKRQGNLDDMTNDVARVFFGVNVSCAKCHDHPLVADWRQDHYYGMSAFLAGTYEASKAKKMGEIGEKPASEVMFVTTKGERRTAKTMFLSGRILEEKKDAKTPPSRRTQLVEVALEEKTFLSRSIVNRLWSHVFGRGLVEPLDQLHSANPASVPGLLEELAADLVVHHYDLDRLVFGLVTSKAYGLDSRPPAEGDGRDSDFGRALLKPLTPQQYAMSLLLAVGDDSFESSRTPEARAKKYRELEGAAGPLLRPNLLDNRGDRYQASTGEALFLSNHAEVQKLLVPQSKNLMARLGAVKDQGQLVEEAYLAILGRAPDAEERGYLRTWVAQQKGTPATVAGRLAWALLTSAEFRFNH